MVTDRRLSTLCHVIEKYNKSLHLQKYSILKFTSDITVMCPVACVRLFSALEVIYNEMRYINLRFTYSLYLLTSTRGHSLNSKTEVTSCKTRARHNSFNQSVVSLRNSLPEFIVCALSINCFKNRLHAYTGRQKCIYSLLWRSICDRLIA